MRVVDADAAGADFAAVSGRHLGATLLGPAYMLAVPSRRIRMHCGTMLFLYRSVLAAGTLKTGFPLRACSRTYFLLSEWYWS